MYPDACREQLFTQRHHWASVPCIVIPWIDPQSPLPAASTALDRDSNWPGLVCASEDLSASRLREAYSQGLFPWYSDEQPVLWWSPDPRMLLPTAQFKLRRSLRQRIRQLRQGRYELRVDTQFHAVMQACASVPRKGQDGTWITPAIRAAYGQLHADGMAHSVEIWSEGRLVGGLYAVNLGRAVFGESMFALEPDTSKLALAALVALCRAQGAAWIDCQQDTSHLTSLGAGPIARAEFLRLLHEALPAPALDWEWRPVYWDTF